MKYIPDNDKIYIENKFHEQNSECDPAIGLNEEQMCSALSELYAKTPGLPHAEVKAPLLSLRNGF